MAGQAQRGSRARGRSPRRGPSSAPRGPLLTGAPGPAVRMGSTATRTDPGPRVDPLVTGFTYRLLLMRGLSPEEAANLTAFMCGIPVSDVHWSIRQINQLLSLRQLARTGRFESGDGDLPRPN